MTIPSDRAARLPLFFQRRFLPMWTALSFGTFADNTLRQALLIGIPAGIISVPMFSSPDDAIPVIGTLLPAAILLFSSVSGQLADKYETSFMFRRTKSTELLLMIIAGAAFAFGWVRDEGVFAKRRRTKGRDSMAACGQLGTEEVRKRKFVGLRIDGGDPPPTQTAAHACHKEP